MGRTHMYLYIHIYKVSNLHLYVCKEMGTFKASVVVLYLHLLKSELLEGANKHVYISLIWRSIL